MKQIPIIDSWIEDAFEDDVSAQLLKNLGIDTHSRAVIKAKQGGVFSGASIVSKIFEEFSSRQTHKSLRLKECFQDSVRFEAGTSLLVFEGLASSILSVERVLLNWMQHLSGVATQTQKYV